MRSALARKRKLAVVGVLTAIGMATPVVSAVAAEISGSRLPFSIATSGSKEDGDRWKGKSSGHAKACGDVPVNDTRTFSAYIYQDKSFRPDPQIASTSRSYRQGYGCGSYKGTSTSGKYYTKATWSGISGSRAYGYVNAQN
ncbi:MULTISPECIES: hypothetical protein [Streptomyces]|uniref:Uncharacterized protein n=1 Tax=Streptomyces chengmaiensis TaxID=3040919 RepID=A0ABT6HJT1_9ACTN|nr:MULTISPECIES: hypothetical protein [Streptomyces]MDH2389007.1 hypothetical protein [Streptomyces chengmaiensis]WRQ82710.1 hypothetical protein I3F59_027040 [Streptomyces sp. MUM 178J]